MAEKEKQKRTKRKVVSGQSLLSKMYVPGNDNTIGSSKAELEQPRIEIVKPVHIKILLNKS